MERDLRKYEEMLIKEIEGSRFFSLKQIVATIKLNGVCRLLCR